MSVERRAGLIDSLATGFAIVARRPYLLAVPLLMDAFIWAGPRLTARPVMQSLGDGVLNILSQGPLSPEELVNANQRVQELIDITGNWNVLEVLAWQVPNLLGASSLAGPGPHATIASLGLLLVALLGLALVAVFVACVFLSPIASLVRRGGIGDSFSLKRLVGLWLRYVAYISLILGALVVLGLGATLLVGIGTLLGALGLALVVIIVVAVGILLTIYLFLAEEAILVGGAGPLAAIKQSFAIASRHFWSVVGLVLLVNVITVGLGLIWERVSNTTPGLLVAAMGNSFIATGLTASVMVYYWERFKQISETPPLPIGDQERRLQ